MRINRNLSLEEENKSRRNDLGNNKRTFFQLKKNVISYL